MRKANIADVPQNRSGSPHGKFGTIDQDLNEALGSDFRSMDLDKRWPFAVEVTRVPAGKPNYPYHSHGSMFEFYFIVSGTGTVRHKDGTTDIKPGDFFMFAPGEAHQIMAGSEGDLVYHCVADNPYSDHAYYPDSDKYSVRMPKPRQIIKGKEVDYYAGEDEKPL
jgi:uncharacterized cupin superfamily protein